MSNNGLIKLQEFRNEAGRRLFYSGAVRAISETRFTVHSSSFNEEYDIEIIEGHYYCSCPDYEKRSKFLTCKHIKAVQERQKVFITSCINYKC